MDKRRIYQVPTAGKTISLLKLAQVNEDIKAVVNLSRGIGLGAINAGLLSNKSSGGAGAVGFGVAAAELRAFSGRLEAMMSTVEAAVFKEIGDAATLLKLERRHNTLVAAEVDAGSGALASRLQSTAAAIRCGQDGHAIWREKLLLLLVRAEQLCRSGHVTARVARMESVGGGQTAVQMAAAVGEIESSVLHALAVVRKLILQIGQKS